MKIGVALPHYDPPTGSVDPAEVASIAQKAEQLGFDSVWVSDHLMFDLAKYGGSADAIGALDPFVTLTHLAAVTKRITLGTMVLCNEFRHPGVVAKMAANIQIISDGRLELGIGAGWYGREFDAFGIEFPSAGMRLGKLAEAVQIIRGLLTGEPFSFDGRHYQLHDAVCRPAPATPPPIWIGAKGDQAIGIAGQLADGWNAAWFSDPDAYAERATQLGDSTVRRSIGQYAQGSAQEMVDRLGAFAALGVEHVVMCFSDVPFGLDDPADLEAFASNVIPHVCNLGP